MKRSFVRAAAALTAAMICASALTSCSVLGGDGKTGYLSEYFTGEFLPMTATGSDNAQMLCNNLGMSGLEASNQLHGNNSAEMATIDVGGAFIFELEETAALGRVFVWNYCAKGKTDIGIKNAAVEYSVDGKNYASLGTFLFSEGDSSGDESYNGVIDFAGVAARYIRITAKENYGNSSKSGLAEVRAYRFKTHPEKAGTVITGKYIDSNLNNSAKVTQGENIANNAGMNGALSIRDRHSNNPDDMAFADLKNGTAVFTVYLDGTYPVDKLYIWNYNDPEHLDRGAKKVRIYTAGEGNVFIPLKNDDGSTTFMLNQASGKDGIGYTDCISLGGKMTGAIRIEVQRYDGTYGDTSVVGLSEIRVTAAKGYAVEPAREWTGLFSKQSGWTAADGIFTVNLNGYDVQGSTSFDTTTLFIFSDTAYGNVNYSNMHVHRDGFVNHSFAYLTGTAANPKNMQWVLTGSNGWNVFGDSLWLTDAVRIGDRIKVGCMKYNSSWGADRMDIGTITISKNTGLLNMSTASRVEGVNMMKKYTVGDTMFIAGILNESIETGNPNGDGYIYIYGFHNTGSGKKNLVVARSLPSDYDNVDNWEFYDGSQWIKDIGVCSNKNAFLCKDDISSELSVTKIKGGIYNGKYMLVYTHATMGKNIRFALADSPTGPFENISFAYYCPEEDYYHALGDNGFYTYNTKAHPSLSLPGELLISYNCNSTTNYDIDTWRYHPVFIRMYEIG